MPREQQILVRKLHEQQSIKPIYKQPSTEARIAVIKAQLMLNTQSKKRDVMQNEGETPISSAWGGNRINPVVACQALGGKYKEPN